MEYVPNDDDFEKESTYSIMNRSYANFNKNMSGMEGGGLEDDDIDAYMEHLLAKEREKNKDDEFIFR